MKPIFYMKLYKNKNKFILQNKVYKKIEKIFILFIIEYIQNNYKDKLSKMQKKY